MTDRAKIQMSWERMKSGNVLTKYKQQNPGEVAKLDAYVAGLAAGQNPVEPVLATLFGSGLADLIAAGVAPEPAADTFGQGNFGEGTYGG